MIVKRHSIDFETLFSPILNDTWLLFQHRAPTNTQYNGQGPHMFECSSYNPSNEYWNYLGLGQDAMEKDFWQNGGRGSHQCRRQRKPSMSWDIREAVETIIGHAAKCIEWSICLWFKTWFQKNLGQLRENGYTSCEKISCKSYRK